MLFEPIADCSEAAFVVSAGRDICRAASVGLFAAAFIACNVAAPSAPAAAQQSAADPAARALGSPPAKPTHSATGAAKPQKQKARGSSSAPGVAGPPSAPAPSAAPASEIPSD